MRELAILTFITLDGVMQAPKDASEDPSNGFSSAGWANPCWDDVMTQVQAEAMAEPYDMLFGRGTFDTFAAARSESGDDPMTQATKYVVTSNPDTVTWENTRALTGEPAAEIAKLKQAGGPLLQVHGSWQLIQLLLANKLVDELRLWTFPVLLGEGKRLFSDIAQPGDLKLMKTAPAGSSGAVMNIYRPEW